MRIVAAILGVMVIALMLSEFFVTFMLPRRVRRDPPIAPGFLRALWRPWRAYARRVAAGRGRHPAARCRPGALAGSRARPARVGGVGGRADGDPPLVPDPRLVPLPTRQSELAGGTHRDDRRGGLRDRGRVRRRG